MDPAPHRSPVAPAPGAGAPPEAYLALGVLAHVDAGKTSLTEALLVAGGALDQAGRVDDGTTQTDTLAQERARGITIRAAVATFRVGDVAVNLVDTPGHPDFVAEVDRSLAVLDGAVLVVSAVEGVQAQTVVLHRALRRLRVPTVVFVNKVDRSGADPGRVVAAVAARLGQDLVPLGTVHGAGRRSAIFVPARWEDPLVADAVAATLAGHDDDLLARWLEHDHLDAATLRRELGRLTRAGLVHPVVLGSARTGTGVPALVDAVTGLLAPPPGTGDAIDRPPSGQVFAVEHDARGRRVCTVRVRNGTLVVRDRVHLGADRSGVVTALEVFEPGVRSPGTASSSGSSRACPGSRQPASATGWAPGAPGRPRRTPSRPPRCRPRWWRATPGGRTRCDGPSPSSPTSTRSSGSARTPVRAPCASTSTGRCSAR